MNFKHFFESMGDGNSVDWDSVYAEYVGEVRQACKNKGISIDTARLVNSNRSALGIKDVKDGEKFHQWYGIGTAWFDWMSWQMPHWIAPVTHAVILNEGSIMKISDQPSIEKFENNYIKDKRAPKDEAIKWKELYAKGVGAVEFNPYLGGSLGWYRTIDIPSGAIVNKRCVTKTILLFDGTTMFNDLGIKSGR